MYTHFLGKEQVDAYLMDLRMRLEGMTEARPTLLCPIGTSGEVLIRELFRLWPELADMVAVLRVDFDRTTQKLMALDRPDQGADSEAYLKSSLEYVPHKRVLVIDSSVHSGVTMLSVVRAMYAAGASAVCSYALVLKRGALFVPGIWGLTIEDHDRAYFLLSRLPNNRLSVTLPFIHIRKLSSADLGLPSLHFGSVAIDSLSLTDRYDAMIRSHRAVLTYLLEDRSEVVGIVTFEKSDTRLRILELAVVTSASPDRAGAYGNALLRWAETNARNSHCEEVQIWTFARDVPSLVALGYASKARAIPRDGSPERKLMVKRVLYHI
jgi:hypothetical protein